MSPSSSPVRYPRRARASARFTATVDLPTPPLPLATATLYGTSCRSVPGRDASASSRAAGR